MSIDLTEFFSSLDTCEDKRSSTHGIHPYPAKFIPHIPRALIDAYTDVGDVVLDPMCGSGTTVVEATLAGRVGLGGDINPVSTLVSSAKTVHLGPAHLVELSNLLDEVRDALSGPTISRDVPEFHNRDHWFSDGASQGLAECVHLISSLSLEESRILARSALSAIIVSVSRQDSETRWARVDREVTRREVMERYARRLSYSVERSQEYSRSASGEAVIWRGDARNLPLADDSVDLIVTSPPYANSHDYYLYHKLRMFWLGFDVRSVQEAEFGSRNKHSDKKLEIDHYLAAMAGVLSESHRVLRDGAHACIVVGDAVIRGEFFDMGDQLRSLADQAGLKVTDHFRFAQQRYTKTFTRGFGTSHLKSTHVLVMSSLPW